ncbi:MAG: class I SAM-dependent methyltransferase [Clostridia bacterium]|nr:class I SAM-dependent methyltransferase [Clostridia bacterium]
MNEYSSIADFYDLFTQDVDYDGRAQYINELLKRCEIGCKTVLDLACGTGSMTIRLAKMGYDMIGVDSSEDMLCVARDKSENCPDILWLCQEGAELDLYGDIDCAICTLDSVNHILDFDEVVDTFKRVSLFMNKGGYFIFDVNTAYKHHTVLGNNSFVLEEDGVFCAWQNEYEEENNIVHMQLDFFREAGDSYDRCTQCVSERAYTTQEILNALRLSSFELVHAYEDMTFDEPTETTERIFYVARNVKK